MSRTPIDLDPSGIRDMREGAYREKKSMGQLATELLSRALAVDDVKPPPFEWISHDLGLPLIDLEDKDALWAILDERE